MISSNQIFAEQTTLSKKKGLTEPIGNYKEGFLAFSKILKESIHWVIFKEH